MNVLTDFPYRFRYYLTHPWRFFRDLRLNLRNAWWRIKYGWAPCDVWNWDSWFLTVAPAMFKYLAENCSSYPGQAPFETPEKWREWLNGIATKLESCREENYEKENEYHEEYIKQFEHYDVENKDKELDKKYFARDREIFEDVEERVKECLNSIGDNFFTLWD